MVTKSRAGGEKRAPAVKAPAKKGPRPRDISAQVARNLRLAREEIDPNRTRFALTFGVGQSVWAKWEAGAVAGSKKGAGNYPDPAVMVELCNRHGLTMDYLYRGIIAYMPNERVKLALSNKPEFREAYKALPEDTAALAVFQPPAEGTPPAVRSPGKAKAKAD